MGPGYLPSLPTGRPCPRWGIDDSVYTQRQPPLIAFVNRVPRGGTNVRTFRLILIPALTLLVASAAYACDKDKASAQASTGSCSSMKAASANGGCSAHAIKTAAMADAHHDCPFCNLATEIRAQK